jgi:hypothetical protein
MKPFTITPENCASVVRGLIASGTFRNQKAVSELTATDAGELSRYLNGTRDIPWAFVDRFVAGLKKLKITLEVENVKGFPKVKAVSIAQKGTTVALEASNALYQSIIDDKNKIISTQQDMIESLKAQIKLLKAK